MPLNANEIYPTDLENPRKFFHEVTYNASELIKQIDITTQYDLPETRSRKLKLQITNKRSINGSNGINYNFNES